MSQVWARNWWGAAWVDKMFRLAESHRFVDGEEYARKGRVKGIQFDGRTITASVGGSREQPYRVRISFDPFSSEQWACLLAEVRERDAFRSSISSSDLPLEIQTAFSKANLRFMPERYVDLHLECACADWFKPCKHMVAVWLKFAREFDRDPFLVFELRGLKRDELLALLSDRQPEPIAGGDEFPEVVIPPKIECLPSDPEAFWSSPALPAAHLDPRKGLNLEDEIIEKLKDWPGLESQFYQIYDAVYDLASLLTS